MIERMPQNGSKRRPFCSVHGLLWCLSGRVRPWTCRRHMRIIQTNATAAARGPCAFRHHLKAYPCLAVCVGCASPSKMGETRCNAQATSILQCPRPFVMPVWPCASAAPLQACACACTPARFRASGTAFPPSAWCLPLLETQKAAEDAVGAPLVFCHEKQ